ncbi:hypothetical protein P3T76_007884 [Phytophthora citrophthora]|uniref:Uncharacterized protein n=1 Tax=Phytophthora citrophthora TaxID=4793 RepID=A0AAD9LKX4_9STRA|nr:hypothetical protein P3T76_007884 [Phytophthora citrophthora]
MRGADAEETEVLMETIHEKSTSGDGRRKKHRRVHFEVIGSLNTGDGGSSGSFTNRAGDAVGEAPVLERTDLEMQVVPLELCVDMDKDVGLRQPRLSWPSVVYTGRRHKSQLCV